jgi:hypothetical protein
METDILITVGDIDPDNWSVIIIYGWFDHVVQPENQENPLGRNSNTYLDKPTTNF